ncbi:MAG: hypothetical protein U1B83_04345 [Candidatus Cloacimonadaceae bacterium]|nr:hypothetical protein [Candidatus Cloacimonadaceae bacterium]
MYNHQTSLLEDKTLVAKMIAELRQKVSRLDPEGEFQTMLEFLLSRKHHTGSKVVLSLMCNPDTPVHALNLTAMLDRGVSDIRHVPFLHAETLEMTPLPMTDAATIRDCRKRSLKLIDKIAALEAIGMNAEAKILREENDAILSYLSSCTRPGKQFRNFPDISAKAYSRIRMILKRIMDEATACSPEAAYIMQKHIDSGVVSYWRSSAEQKRRIENSFKPKVKTLIAEQTKIEDIRGDNTPRIHKE